MKKNLDLPTRTNRLRTVAVCIFVAGASVLAAMFVLYALRFPLPPFLFGPVTGLTVVGGITVWSRSDPIYDRKHRPDPDDQPDKPAH